MNGNLAPGCWKFGNAHLKASGHCCLPWSKESQLRCFGGQTMNEESRSYQAGDQGRSADGRGLYTL